MPELSHAASHQAVTSIRVKLLLPGSLYPEGVVHEVKGKVGKGGYLTSASGSLVILLAL